MTSLDDEATLERKRYEMAEARGEACAYRSQYDSIWHSQYSRYENSVILSFLPADQASIVLDVGCGVGPLLRDLVARYQHVIGLDISASALSLVQMNSPRLRGLTVADGERLPYRSGTFDVVVLRASLHHIPEIDTALDEFRRVLKPNGTLLMAEPCGDHFLVRYGRGVLSKRQERYFQSWEMRDYLRRHGFTAIKLKRIGYLAFAITYLLRTPVARLNKPTWLYGFCLRALIVFDEALSRTPILRTLSLGIIAVAKAPKASNSSAVRPGP